MLKYHIYKEGELYASFKSAAARNGYLYILNRSILDIKYTTMDS